MPWELSSALSRLRRPVRHQNQDSVPQEASVPQLPIDRKILQDPNSFLDTQTDAVPHGLTPSTRLPSSEAGSKSRSHSRPRPTDPSSVDPPECSELPPGSVVDISPQTPPRLIGRTSKTASGGEWSTFGRRREHRIVELSEPASPLHDPKNTSHSPSPTRDKKHLSADSIPSLRRLTNSSSSIKERHSMYSTRSTRQSPDMRSSSKRSSPTNTASSKRHPHTPQGRSYTTPANYDMVTDSPHTFGHPTPPPDNPPISYTSLAPPLPPLDHPELAAVLSTRRKTMPMSASQSALSAFRDRSNTLPTNARKDDLFASLSFKLGRSARHRSNSPDSQTPAGSRGRRTSADWSSYQASEGDTTSWPAQVSREMVRLSLGLETRAPGSSGNHHAPARAQDAVHRPNRGSLSASFLPFPHPSSRPGSPPPSNASATLPDGREIMPVRPRSLQFTHSDPRGRDQPAARLTTAAVKRSVSAIEPRKGPKKGANGATYASGLTDPAPTSSTPSKTPQALARSRSLLTGRVSPSQTPMSTSALGEPSTPTPAPRQLSDKSRGKRKAEDNIDITPPEQKKEGQRATFLLPSEPRSQRVSNSSHAPSSYHRKRARLSSTSPFATPVQSRAPSIQETPQSATRNRPFSSLSSGTGARIAPSRTPSRAASAHSRQPPPTPSTNRKHERRQSVSQVSIPISAIVSPHAPSISRSTKFHMRDPRRPPKKRNDTPWSLRFTTEDEPGSPIQAWCFFLGFMLFPVWWIAGLFLSVPRTRIAGDVEAEKGVTIDDPQIEHDAKTWRFRCRVMAMVSLFTYVPFIVLVAIFAPR